MSTWNTGCWVLDPANSGRWLPVAWADGRHARVAGIDVAYVYHPESGEVSLPADWESSPTVPDQDDPTWWASPVPVLPYDPTD